MESGKMEEMGSLKYRVQFPQMPLTVYRELAAHLSQVLGVTTALQPQHSQQFDYHQSQVGALWLEYGEDAEPGAREQVERILAYYGDRYGGYNLLP